MRYRHLFCAASAAAEGVTRRIPALDGSRAEAIAMVVGYHVDSSVVPAGHYGVILFLVLSGCVVTGSLCAEMDRTGRIDVGSFYRRRVLRLLPVLVAVCCVMVAVGTGWSGVIAVLGFSADYARIGGLDLGRLTHTWFVAVIAHFYALWPLVIAAVQIFIAQGIRDPFVPRSVGAEVFNRLADPDDRLSAEEGGLLDRGRVPDHLSITTETYFGDGDPAPVFARQSASALLVCFQPGHEMVCNASARWSASDPRSS